MVLLDFRRMPRGSVHLRVPDGKIVDYGPITFAQLGGLKKIALSSDERSINISVDGFQGDYIVATEPALTPIEVSADAGDQVPSILVGKLQVPIETMTKNLIDPRGLSASLMVSEPPTPRFGAGAGLGIAWYQPAKTVPTSRESLDNDFKRVMREWGYIR